jgi:hypothetical protein
MPMAIIRATKLADKRIRGDMVWIPSGGSMTVRLGLIDFLLK